jgi:vacuolar protein sorting-associated protein 41
MATPSPSSKAISPSSHEDQMDRDEQEGVESSDDEEEEEEEEPQLKYERIGGDIAKVVRSDLVSTVCVGSKVIVLPFISFA